MYAEAETAALSQTQNASRIGKHEVQMKNFLKITKNSSERLLANVLELLDKIMKNESLLLIEEEWYAYWTKPKIAGNDRIQTDSAHG